MFSSSLMVFGLQRSWTRARCIVNWQSGSALCTVAAFVPEAGVLQQKKPPARAEGLKRLPDDAACICRSDSLPVFG
ncbi:hypothetical protein [uncultured Martelella sp.]|uniref:hypothetical protein n=1 Tax=uncultured Martelella sp. TaxID=392331 RepID=UPI0029C7EB3C|nr:hypothetical protein [uncultured Martelella sp.]